MRCIHLVIIIIKGGGVAGQQYGRQIQKTEKPRERTKALLGVVREVFSAKKNAFTDNYEAP